MRDVNAVESIKLIRPTGKLTFRVLPSCPANAGHPVRCGHAAGAHTIKPGEIQHSDARCRLVSLFAARIAGEPLLGREYALVYRAGFLNQTTSFKFRLWDKSYDFTHVCAPRLEKIFQQQLVLTPQSRKTRAHHKKLFPDGFAPVKKPSPRERT